MKKTIDKLLQSPYWVIDILPEQVPKGSAGQFFAVEKYYLQEKQLAEIKQKHINVILKLNCYRDISIDEETMNHPSLERIAEEIRKRHLCIRIDEAMILSEPDDVHMTIFNPDEKLLNLTRAIAAAEGLFVWKPSV